MTTLRNIKALKDSEEKKPEFKKAKRLIKYPPIDAKYANDIKNQSLGYRRLNEVQKQEMERFYANEGSFIRLRKA